MTAADPFDTHRRRRVILQSWAASPTRFREDANAEEDLVVGGYADRLLVELAQNAADAARAAGVPGSLRLRLVDTADGVALSAANTGDPLSAAGVDALTSLRASSKRDPDAASVGRFGVGFAAVLAVSDAPELRSRTGGVRFSAADTGTAIADADHLVAEAARRGGRVPVLRLPWPVAQPPVDGYDTEVLLPLRDARAVRDVESLLADFDPTLLLSLPALATVDVAGRVVARRPDSGEPREVVIDDAGTATRWRVAARGGEFPADLLADRPVEERERTRWSVLAAVPLDRDHRPVPLAEPQLVYAPTASDEPSGLAVRLSATFPLDVTRRRVPAGPLADLLAVAAGETAADLVADLGATGAAVLALVPRPGFAPAPLAAAIRESTLAALAERTWLPTVGGAARRPSRVTAVPDPLVGALSDVDHDLLPAGWWTRHYAPVLAGLGVRERDIADVVDLVAGVAREPAWWRSLYDGLAAAATEPAHREALAALPVPLVDGRTVTGPAGVLLPSPDLPAAAVSALGLRVAHPDAVHPVLERLGARVASPRSVLADDRVAVAVAGCYDADPDDADASHQVAAAVLALVAAAGLRPGDEPQLADLSLPGDDGDWYAAEEMLLPDGPLARVVEADAPFGRADAALVARWGAATLAAVGALATFAVLDESDVDTVDVAELHLDGGTDWAAMVRRAGGVTVDRLHAVRDLEWVRPDAWPDALAMLAAEPLRSVLAASCHARRSNGHRITVPPYTRWWLARRPVLGGHRPAELRLPDALALAGLYDPAPGDAAVAGLLGAWPSDDVLLSAAATDPDVAADLLARLGDPARTATAELTATVYSRLAAADLDVDPPRHIRVAPDVVAPAERVVVIDQPWLLSRLGDHHPVAGGPDPAAVADLLDVPLLSELPPP